MYNTTLRKKWAKMNMSAEQHVLCTEIVPKIVRYV